MSLISDVNSNPLQIVDFEVYCSKEVKKNKHI